MCHLLDVCFKLYFFLKSCIHKMLYLRLHTWFAYGLHTVAYMVCIQSAYGCIRLHTVAYSLHTVAYMVCIQSAYGCIQSAYGCIHGLHTVCIRLHAWFAYSLHTVAYMVCIQSAYDCIHGLHTWFAYGCIHGLHTPLLTCITKRFKRLSSRNSTTSCW